MFVATLLGSIIAFRNKFAAAFIAAVLFAAVFVFWTYYPRDNLPDAIRAADQREIGATDFASQRAS